MGKLVVIGDIHGRSVWRKIVDDNPDAEKFIFLGDYFDSHEKKYYPSKQVFNFKAILEFQKHIGSDKVILLLGNHDYHYMNNRKHYTGYNQITYFDASPLLRENYSNGNIKIIHKESNFLFSHAGITDYWLHNISSSCDINKLNDTNTFDLRTLEWNANCGYDEYGNTKSNSPIWVRPEALTENKFEEYIQIVGHTWFHPDDIESIIKKGQETGIYMCDCLPHHYLIINENEFKYIEIHYETKND